ncbi:hypothetical protein R3X25_13540 [Lutibacter sp. TH_r2]|uniref:carboxypeptidase-like regulatory domain-containing protein n=1 Tax=Lutibacter sp. TH_r2 TaxID=3082083 RepID=UPI002954D597|nr:hypothetical protein [Lutibacter sp. TH_r2]MDV7188312.1 hypothetical protein [Lutibacter sp. TH_r2]
MKKYLLLTLSCFIFFTCQKDDAFKENIENPEELITDEQFADKYFGELITTDFIGQIVDEAGEHIPNVQITLRDQTTVTDQNGVFIINNASVFDNFAHIKASKAGYINGSRTLIPLQNASNNIRITLIKKIIVDSINSGEISEIGLPNGAKVVFQGIFIDSDANNYNGQVDVSINYLAPNQQETFNAMPGMLFGKRENGNATSMETYGMLSVSLTSPSGEQLNISETAPATLTFPIDTSTPNAPAEIALWSFDDEVGYWKEEGTASRVGNQYEASVTHFSWWNVDYPFEGVNVCLTLTDLNGADVSNNYIEIIMQSTEQMIFSGYTNISGQLCGLFPQGEQTLLKVYSNCSTTLIYDQPIDPFNSDTDINITIDDVPDYQQTTIIADLVDCNANLITNGYLALLSGSNVFETVSLTGSSVNFDFSYCPNASYTLIAYDFDTNKRTDFINLNFTPEGDTNLNTISICENLGGVKVGNVTLTSQDEVDFFGYLGYQQIEGNLVIGLDDSSSDITSLVNLNTLTSVSSSLNGNVFIKNNDNLTSLAGLNAIESTSGSLIISNNNALISLSDLSSLTTVEYLDINGNDSLIEIGTPNLTTAGPWVFVRDNPALVNLVGLGNLSLINDANDSWLLIENNDALVSMDGLENISNISELSIRYNSNLTSLNGLEGLNNDISNPLSFGIQDNPLLASIDGLKNVSAMSYLTVILNPSLQTLSGLDNLTSVVELKLSMNSALNSINSLSNLSPGNLDNVYIHDNDALQDLSGLEGVQTITNALSIFSNENLSSLTGLENLISLKRVIIGPFGYVNDSFNPSLTDFCALQNLFVNGTYETVEIAHNGYNPTVEDIQAGDCSLN